MVQKSEALFVTKATRAPPDSPVAAVGDGAAPDPSEPGAGPEPQRVKVTLPEQKESRLVTVEEAVTPLPAYIESLRSADYPHADDYALELLGDVLSNGKSSRLYQRLVDKDQLSIQAASFNVPLERAGLFAFYSISNMGVTFEQVEKAIAEEIARVQKEGISEEEFQKVRNAKEASFTRSFMSLDGKLRNLASYSLFYGNTALVNKEIEMYMKVTRDDIKRVANTYLRPERRSVVKYVVPEKQS